MYSPSEEDVGGCRQAKSGRWRKLQKEGSADTKHSCEGLAGDESTGLRVGMRGFKLERRAVPTGLHRPGREA